MAQDDEYKVGFGKPPKATRFKPGQSGNAKGRPKGSANFATEFEDELRARISVTENGHRKRISKRRAAAKQVVNKAASGDPKALAILLNEVRPRESLRVESSDVLSTPEDQQVISLILERMRRNFIQEQSDRERCGAALDADSDGGDADSR